MGEEGPDREVSQDERTATPGEELHDRPAPVENASAPIANPSAADGDEAIPDEPPDPAEQPRPDDQVDVDTSATVAAPAPSDDPVTPHDEADSPDSESIAGRSPEAPESAQPAPGETLPDEPADPEEQPQPDEAVRDESLVAEPTRSDEAVPDEPADPEEQPQPDEAVQDESLVAEPSRSDEAIPDEPADPEEQPQPDEAVQDESLAAEPTRSDEAVPDEPADPEEQAAPDEGMEGEAHAALASVIDGEAAGDSTATPSATADLKPILEALIFASPDPLTRKAIAKLLASEPAEDIDAALEALKVDYDRAGGLQLVEVAGGYQIVTRQDLHEWVRRLFHERTTQKLTVAALETLAVIAYKQPLTALEINEIRGVKGAGVLNTLLERHLVKIVGRKKVVGRPFMYATTKEFLIRFGLNDLEDLPEVEDMAEALGIEVPLLVERSPSEDALPLDEPDAADPESADSEPADADSADHNPRRSVH